MKIHIQSAAIQTDVHASHRVALCGATAIRQAFRGEPTCEACMALAPPKRLSPGDSAHVQFRTAQAVRLAVLSRADAEGLTEREAWEAAGREWASRG